MPAANNDSVTMEWYSGRQLGQRQPQRTADETHAGECPFDRNGIGFDEQVSMQRHQALVDLGSSGAVAAKGCGHHVRHGSRRNVRGHGDHPVRADTNRFTRGEIVAAQDPELRAATGPVRAHAWSRRLLP